MIQLNTLVNLPATPDRTTDTAEQFYTKANIWNSAIKDSFSPSVNNFINNLNTLTGQINNVSNTVQGRLDTSNMFLQEASNTYSNVIGNSFKGVWSNTVAYSKGDIVIKDGAYFIALTNNNNNDPINSLDKWHVFKNVSSSTPLLDMNLSKEIPNDFAFLRNSVCNYIDRDGYLKQASVNTPAFTKYGLLIEGGGANMLTQSDVTNSNSLQYSSQVTKTVMSGEGLLNDDALKIETSGTTNGYLYDLTDGTFTAGKYTFSIFVKQVGTNPKFTIELRLYNGSSIINNHWRVFDFSNPHGLDDIEGFKVEKLANGWYRLSITSTAGSDFTRLRTLIRPTDQANPSDGSFIVYGTMLENMDFPTSYIISNGSNGLRYPTYLNSNIKDKMPLNSEYTLYLEFKLIGLVTVNKIITTNTLSNRGVYVDVIKRINTYENGVVTSTVQLEDLDEVVKYCVSVSDQNVNASVPYAASSNNVSLANLSATDKIRFQDVFMMLKRVIIFDKALTPYEVSNIR